MNMFSDLLNSVVENTADGIYFVDLTRRITLWNKSAEDITGYSRREIVGRRCQDNLLNHIDKEGHPLCQTACPLYATMTDGVTRTADVLLRHRDGHRVPVTVRTIPAYKEGSIVGAIEVFTAKTAVQYDDDFIDSLTDLAITDQLTGLPNHMHLESLLNYKLLETARFGKNSCIILIDIDDMHAFNRDYQRQTGDILLQRIAASLNGALGKQNIVGRWEEDEFVVALDLAPNSNLGMIAERIRALIGQSGVMYNRQYISLTACVGLTAVKRGETVQSAITRAQALVRQCKQRGKNCCAVYVPQQSLSGQIPIAPSGANTQ